MLIGMFHCILRSLSMDLPKQKLRDMTGWNTTFGVFRGICAFISFEFEQKKRKDEKDGYLILD